MPGIVAGIGAARRGERGATHVPRTPLAEVVALPTAPPPLRYPPTTRVIDDAGRFTAKIGGASVAELCGWPVGPLRVRTDGFWQVLTADLDGAPVRRFDGRASVNVAGRVRLPQALLHRLALSPGDEVAILVLPDQGAVALCHPSRLLCGAPLALLDQAELGEAQR